MPTSRHFRIFKYRNPTTNRNLKILKCDHENCQKFFRKFHNFYDHLRIHTGERPFSCPYKSKTGCKLRFTQKSNLNKHIKCHQEVKGSYTCIECSKVFKSLMYLKRHAKSHSSASLKTETPALTLAESD